MSDVLGEDGLLSLSILNNIGVALSRMGRHEEALCLFQKLERDSRYILGERHVSYFYYLYNIAASLMNIGNYEEGIKLQKECSVKIR